MFFKHFFPLTFSIAFLSVLDINDNPPKLDQTAYVCYLSEDAARGQFVTVVTASDPDVGDHDRLTYSIVGGNQQQTFSMDPSTGMYLRCYTGDIVTWKG